MEDIILSAKIDAYTTLYVSPIALATYQEHMNEDNLGGGSGYFVLRERRNKTGALLEILAKAPSFEAAGDLFDMIVSGRRAAI